jgi:hypothetical protein
MHIWFKTCRIVTWAAVPVNGLPVLMATVVLLGADALPQSDSVRLGMSAVGTNPKDRELSVLAQT